MRILKFGGTSIGTPDRVERVVKILRSSVRQGKMAVVFSAFEGVTDELVRAGEQAAAGEKSYLRILKTLEQRHLTVVRDLLGTKRQPAVLARTRLVLNELEDVLNGAYLVKELSAKTHDFIVSFGERLSCYIISQKLQQSRFKAEFLDAREVVKTDADFGGAAVNFAKTGRLIRRHFRSANALQVITGFIGSTDKGETTTLGRGTWSSRGGSDYTAAIFAAALKAKEVEIWTHVDGILTADPRKVKKAFPIAELSYEEAMELSHFGAKVIYPPTIQPALDRRIPIRVRNVFNPDFEGTVIKGKTDSRTDQSMIRGISSIGDVALLRLSGSGMVGIRGTSMRLFRALASHEVNVILITQASSEHSISFAVSPRQASVAKQAIEEEFEMEMKTHLIDPVLIERGLSVMAVVGQNMRHIPGVAGRLFHTLGVNGVNILAIAQGSSELNISLVIARKDLNKALNAVHESFFLSDTKTLNLFIAGTGLVGRTLLTQIDEQAESLFDSNKLELRIVGVTNSRKMVFNEEGIEAANWDAALKKSRTRADIEKFTDRIAELNLRNSIFVDNSAHAEVASTYNKLLDSSVSVVTPNKVACSGRFSDYRALKNVAQKRGVKFLFETNVGAGLPVLSTLKDLIDSGDEVIKIEGALSGSLSYIFDELMGGKKFSQAVREAVELGFAEPDPRLDLAGTDVARKALILARESGLRLELQDVEVENLVPEPCRSIDSVPRLFKELSRHDSDFEEVRARARAKKRKLKYIASVEKGGASASLQAIDSSHPFYSLQGNDNMVSFTTNRYFARPLIVRGPGAGAEVTAAGVFADIIRISNL